jgi:hypothetical protein
MIIRNYLLPVCAVILGCVLAAYIVLHSIVAGGEYYGSALSIANECTPGNSSAAKMNPNKMLFVSCGGFLQ